MRLPFLSQHPDVCERANLARLWLLRNIRLTNNPCCCACRYVGNFPRWHLNKLPVRRMLSTTQCTYEQGHSHFYYIISKVNLKCENFISIKEWLIWLVELGTLFRIWVPIKTSKCSINQNDILFWMQILIKQLSQVLFSSIKSMACRWTFFDNG